MEAPKNPDKQSSRASHFSSLEKQKKLLALQKQRLEIDRQLIRNEKKKVRRTAKVGALANSTNQQQAQNRETAQHAARMKEVEEQSGRSVKEWQDKFKQQQMELERARTQMSRMADNEATTAALIANSTVQLEMELSGARMKLRELEDELDTAEADRDHILHLSRVEKQDYEEQMEILEEQLLDRNNNQLHQRRRKDDHDDESNSSEGSTLQAELLKMQYEKETIAEQVIDLEERCRELEEELEEQRNNTNYHHDGGGSLSGSGGGGGGGPTSCATYKDLEEDLYELKHKLNKRQIEHQRQMKELEERLTLEFKNKNTLAVSTAAANDSLPPPPPPPLSSDDEEVYTDDDDNKDDNTTKDKDAEASSINGKKKKKKIKL
eukprot:CAMPEP_0194156858 /NCGR_PEP_ID=MMETSP0152-20130528/69807_1 /TAXON_ID=1049557 /ORGANISM="Thalassiothrix antarctica, Strain L6-D1" /LENGTH=378 /DNA_ID=CAMNT_0038864837 /DNA_START=29 /DNA_END=1162 /DNA_ORIENTATION=-